MEEIDKEIQSQINNLESNIPTDMWARIEKQLPPVTEGRRILPFMMWGGGIVAIVLSAMLYNFYNPTSDLGNSIDNNNKIANTHFETKSKSIATSDKPLGANELSKNTNTHIDISTNTKSSTRTNNKNDIPSPEVTKKVAIFNNYTASETLQKLDVDNKSSKIDNEASSMSNTLLLKGKNTPSIPLLKNESIEEKIQIDQIPTFIEKTELKARNPYNPQVSVQQKNKNILDIPKLNKLSIASLDEAATVDELDKYTEGMIVEPDCPDLEEELGAEYFFMELHLAPIYDKSTLKSKKSGYEEFSKMRQKSESGDFSYNFGFRIGFKNRKGYNFTTGIDFTQLNIKFNHIDSSPIRKITTIDSIFHPNGGLDSVVVKTVTIYGENEIKATNYMAMIDIPLLFSYELDLSPKSSINITAGAFLNLGFSHEARIVNREDVPIWVSSSNESKKPVYKDGLGVSFYLSAGYNFNISPRWRLLLMPNVRYYATQFTVGDYPLAENHTLYGMRVGMRYKF